ncbi:MAG: hypothetical protein V1709_00490 [Planctomycetota bacterium]
MLFNWFKKQGKEEEKEKNTGNLHIKKESQELETKQSPSPKNSSLSDNGNNSQIILTDQLETPANKLGEALLKYDMISRDDLQKALNIQEKYTGTKKKLLGEILVENKFLTEDQLISAFARHCHIPYIKINKYGLSREAIKSVPEELILKHRILPTDKIGSVLIIAVLNPYNTAGIQEIEAKTGLKIKTLLCKQSEFREMVGFYYPNLKDKLDTPPPKADMPLQPETDQPLAEAQKEGYPEGLSSETITITEEETITKTDLLKDLPTPEEKIEKAIAETDLPKDTSLIFIKESPSNESPHLEEPVELIQAKNVSQQPEQIIVPYVSQAKTEQTPTETTQEIIVSSDKQITEKVHPIIEDKQIIKTDRAAIKEEEPVELPQNTNISRQHDLIIAPYASQVQAKQIPTEITQEISVSSDKQTIKTDITAIKEKVSADKKEIVTATSDTILQSSKGLTPDKKILEISAAKPESKLPSTVTTSKKETQNFVVITEEEFIMAKRLLSNQRLNIREQRYHRGRPVRAEKIDDNEFAFYTEDLLKQEK